MACDLEASHWNITRIHEENLQSYGNELYTGTKAYKPSRVNISQQNNASKEQMQRIQGALWYLGLLFLKKNIFF